MTRSLDRIVDAAYRGQAATQVLRASPAALRGVSQGDADRLMAAFGIATVADLAACLHFHNALAVQAAALPPAHDPGPSPAWEALFAEAPIDHYERHPDNQFRPEFGPVYYRGRLDGTARVIVVGQDPASNEQLAHRIFVGNSGQRVQGLLAKLGLTRSYIMLNTFLYGVYDTGGQARLKRVAREEPIAAFRERFLDRLVEQNPVQAVITIGAVAREAVASWAGVEDLPLFNLWHPSLGDADVCRSWNENLQGLVRAVDPDDDGVVDVTPYPAGGMGPEHLTPIPSCDLPFGVPAWHGRGGGHSRRDGAKRIEWDAP